MAITVTQQPELVIPAKNQIDIEVQTDAYVINNGGFAEANITIPVTPGAGTLNIANSLFSLVFTFNAAPNDSGLQIHNNVGAVLTAEVYCKTVVIPALRNNYYLNRYYNISYVSNTGSHLTFKLKAINKGIAYTLTCSSTIGGVSFPLNTAGIDKTVQPNFSVFMDVFVFNNHNDADAVKAYAAEGVPDANNKVLFNLQSILEAVTSFIIPAFGAIGPNAIDGAKRFYCKFLEIYGTTPTPRKYYRWPAGENNTALALHGSSLAEKAPFDNYNDPYYKTTMPSGKIVVTKTQQQYLTIKLINAVDESFSYDFTIDCKLYYTDGTSSAWLTSYSETFPDEEYMGGHMAASVGYTQLGIDAIKAVGKTVASYDVKIYTPSMTPGVFNFLVEQEAQRYPRHFLFINSFGFPETVYFYGIQNRAISFDTTAVQRNTVGVDRANNIVHGEYDETNTTFRKTLEISTGNKDKSHLDYFTDFIASPARYEQQATQWVKVVMDRGDIEMDKDDDTLFALKFKYKMGTNERGNA